MSGPWMRMRLLFPSSLAPSGCTESGLGVSTVKISEEKAWLLYPLTSLHTPYIRVSPLSLYTVLTGSMQPQMDPWRGAFADKTDSFLD